MCGVRLQFFTLNNNEALFSRPRVLVKFFKVFKQHQC